MVFFGFPSCYRIFPLIETFFIEDAVLDMQQNSMWIYEQEVIVRIL
jgi:hypothetical protein